MLLLCVLLKVTEKMTSTRVNPKCSGEWVSGDRFQSNKWSPLLVTNSTVLQVAYMQYIFFLVRNTFVLRIDNHMWIFVAQIQIVLCYPALILKVSAFSADSIEIYSRLYSKRSGKGHRFWCGLVGCRLGICVFSVFMYLYTLICVFVYLCFSRCLQMSQDVILLYIVQDPPGVTGW